MNNMPSVTHPNTTVSNRFSGRFEISAVATTANGVVFDPRSDLWSFKDGTKSVHIDFSSLVELGEELHWGLRKTLIWTAENLAAGTLSATFENLCRLCRVIKGGADGLTRSFTAVSLLNARNVLKESDPSEICFRSCRPFLKRMGKLGFPGISACGAKYLSETKLRGVTSGSAISQLDPVVGPFTDMERETIFDALYSGYANGSIPLSRYVLAWLVALFGQRPKQYALLKLLDLQIIREDGRERCVLKIPQVKARGEAERSRFQEMDLIPELAALMLEYKSQMLNQYVGLLPDPESGPLFPSRGKSAGANVKGFEYHMLAVTITDEIRATFSNLSAISERTGAQMVFNVYRFRYTLGTNCIREGLGVAGTALRLGHTTTISVRPYVALAGAFELHDRVEFSTAARLGTIAQAFKGVLIKTVTNADLDPALHITSPIIDKSMQKGVGRCGKEDFCGFNKPIACYTCFLFNAWLDGPHQLVYDYLEKDRARLLKAGCSAAIVSVNDRAMMAVASIIVQCADEYSKRSFAGAVS
ncbi:site-specific integrase [Massilia brevitalea]|uniref:site-specific integrase n=1 Tax=Massilia brevitalea TaxID=442526 RepID=UPI0027381C39|nr:site-specific integrase [Massilia brevitalea]